jgi:hypothetical protein
MGGKGKKYPPLLSIPISCIYLSTKIGGMTGKGFLVFNSDWKICSGLLFLPEKSH